MTDHLNSEVEKLWIALFKQKGQKLSFPNHYRILVEDENYVYYVDQGNLDLFVTEIINPPSDLKELATKSEPFTTDKVEGKQVFFKEVVDNSLIFSFPCLLDQTIHIIGRSNAVTTIYKLNQEHIVKFFKENKEFILPFFSKLNDWFTYFTPFISRYRIDYPNKVLPLEGFLKCGANYKIIAPHKTTQEGTSPISWVKIKQGSFKIFNMDELELTPDQHLIYPVISETWLQSTQNSILEVVPPEKIVFDAAFWKGFNRFQKDAIHIFSRIEVEKNRLEAEKTKMSRILDKNKLANSLEELEHVLDKQYFFKQEDKNILYNTCQLIGSQLNLNFSLPKETTQKLTIMDQLGQLCYESHIYYRKVRLKEDWWKLDLGPFLGFFGEEQKPVALLPSKQGPYQMIDLEKKIALPIDQDLDQLLATDACMFYRSLPTKPSITSFEILKFGLENKNYELIWSVIFGTIAMILSLFIPFATSVIFSTIIPYAEKPLLLQITLGLILIMLASSIFKYFREYVLLRFQGLFAHDLQAGVWQRIYSLPIKFFKNFEVGDLILRASSIETIRQKIAGPNLRTIINGVFSILFLIPMFYYSWILALAGLMMGLIGILLSIYAMVRTMRINSKIFELQGEANSLVLQSIFGITKIRFSGAENIAFVLWEKIFYKIKKLQWPLEVVNNWANVTNFAISNISQLLLYAIAFHLMQMNTGYEITPGHFIAFLSAYLSFSYALNGLSISLIDISSSLGAWKRSLPIFEQPPEVDPTREKPDELTGQIRVDHISFSYDKSSPLVLDDVSIKADPGEFIAIVGGSGSGKSTLIRMLIGFETPLNGGIYFDNKDLNTLDIQEVRRQIGTVLQTSTVFTGSIRQNVISGNYFSLAEIEEAFTLSGFDEVMKKLPMGLETLVNNEGATLSGGQKQRLIIARALVRKPKILIFDEATSALDNRNQDRLTRNLEELNITRIVIAHRLSTIKNADKIYVFDKGRVVEEGSFEELSIKQGYFSNLLKNQQFE